MFHGLTDKFLTQEEKDFFSTKIKGLGKTASLIDKGNVLYEAYVIALDRMNKIPFPPSKSTFKNEWIAPGVDPNDNELFRWHLISNNEN